MIVRVQTKQSIFDITLQSFGQLDNLVQVCKDNNISISEELEVKQQLIINSEKEGNQKIKDFYLLNSVKPNNDFVNIQKRVNFVFESGDNFILENGNNIIFD